MKKPTVEENEADDVEIEGRALARMDGWMGFVASAFPRRGRIADFLRLWVPLAGDNDDDYG